MDINVATVEESLKNSTGLKKCRLCVNHASSDLPTQNANIELVKHLLPMCYLINEQCRWKICLR